MSSSRNDSPPSLLSEKGLRRISKENNSQDMTTLLELQRKQLTEHFQSVLNLQNEYLKKVEKKCDMAVERVPVLVRKSMSEEISSLRKELEMERKKRRENENSFVEGIDKLLEEVVQLSLKVVVLEGRIEELEKRAEVAEMITELSKDIQAKFQEFRGSQASLQKEVKNVKMDMSYLNYVITPPVEAIMGAQPEPPLGTPLLNLVKWGLENLSDVLPKQGENQTEVDRIPVLIGEDASEIITSTPTNTNTKGVTAPEEPLKNDEEIVVVHKKASSAGRYLPFMCQCGLEFDSEDSLSKHATDEFGPERSPKVISSDSDSGDDLFTLATPMKPATAGKEPSNKLRKTQKPMPRSKKLLLMAQRSQRNGNLTKQLPISPHPKTQLLSNQVLKATPLPVPISTNKHYLFRQDKDENGNPLFICKCRKTYSSKFNLTRHVRELSTGRRRRHSKPSNFTPQFQPNQVQKPDSLTLPNSLSTSNPKHGPSGLEKDENGNPQFVCKCGNTYSSKHSLARHAEKLIRRHRRFNCHLCSKNYAQLHRLKEHLKKDHKINGEQWKGKIWCNLCLRMFENMQQLVDHRSESHSLK